MKKNIALFGLILTVAIAALAGVVVGVVILLKRRRGGWRVWFLVWIARACFSGGGNGPFLFY